MVNMHAGVPKAVEDVVNAMPHDAHPMAVILTGKQHGHTHAAVKLIVLSTDVLPAV
jgi:hypothetical protein